LNSKQALKNKYFFKNKFQKDKQYSTIVIQNVNNKTLLNRILIIHREITRESTQRMLAFYEDD